MITTVVSHFKWTPDQIKKLHTDEEDFQGLEFWYDHVVSTIKKLNS